MKRLLLFMMVFPIASVHLLAQDIDFESITPEQLPAGTKVIPKGAFAGRVDLIDVVIPEGVEVIEPGAFYGSTIQKVTLPSTLVRAYGAFDGAGLLKDVTCLSIVPPYIGPLSAYETISLEYYKDLESVYEHTKWHSFDGIQGNNCTINWYVYDNTGMDEKRLLWEKSIKGEKPQDDYIYLDSYYKAPYKVTSSAYGLWGYDYNRNSFVQVYEDDAYVEVLELEYRMRDHTLTHPAITPYELELGWNQFPVFKTFDVALPASLRVGAEYALSNAPFTNKPDLTVAVGIDNRQKAYYAGHMSVLGGTHSYGTFNLEQDIYGNNYHVLAKKNIYATELDRSNATLYTEVPMRADVVKTTWRLDEQTYDQSNPVNKWIFTSLPFDCRLSDLRVTEGGKNLQWVIYKHSGKMRADAKFDEVWVKQTTDSILHAGEGFIFLCGWNDRSTPEATIEFTALNNANKNRIFTTKDVSVPLHNYPAVAESHRSWNFIGNPYPCYFSIRYFEPGTPIVVSNKTDRWSLNYQTFSPIDDDYLLSPFQSFFVQRPLGHDALNFPEYGRFVTADEYETFMGQLMDEPDFTVRPESSSAVLRRMVSRKVMAPRPPVGTMENRRVINLRLKGADGAELDRTRLVGNPDASIGYESVCDATKFPDLTGTSSLLYIIGADDTRYAISEQPFVEGDEVSVGAKFPVAGEYTMQADFKTPYADLAGKVMLIDHETGHVQSAIEPYTFTAQAGETTKRFALTYGEPTSIRETVNSQQSTVNYYDLQGRPATGTLRPGIYIKNGKKIIIK